MTDTCTCPPDDCHGGRTINIGPAWVAVSDGRLRELSNPDFRVDPETLSMAAELLALRARVTEAEEARDIAEGQWRLSCAEANAARDRIHALEYMLDTERQTTGTLRELHDKDTTRITELEDAQREPIGYLVLELSDRTSRGEVAGIPAVVLDAESAKSWRAQIMDTAPAETSDLVLVELHEAMA